MRAITVKQPWASAIIHGGKDVENRTTNIVGTYRGPLAIIAGKMKANVIGTAQEPLLFELWNSGTGYPLVLGAIIGVVDLVDVHHARAAHVPLPEAPWITSSTTDACCGPWAERNVHHLVLRNPRPLAEPIPITGFLGCRALPADVVAQIEEQIG